MSGLRPIELSFVDSLVDIGQGPGYVLDFTNTTFAEFFARELNVDICDPVYQGGSKGKRLRKFLELADKPLQLRTLDLLWEHRRAVIQYKNLADPLSNAQGRFLELRNRLISGYSNNQQRGFQPAPASNRPQLSALRASFRQVWDLSPQSRGVAFEKFLRALFDVSGLESREAFRLVGEQIDGSFQLSGETYLLEAKWTAELTGVDFLHVFNGKLGEKAAWARGLFISYNGFTDGGMVAFGRGKRVICMDGLDIDDTFRRELPLSDVIEKKARHAAETGLPFCRVRDLFPE